MRSAIAAGQSPHTELVEVELVETAVRICRSHLVVELVHPVEKFEAAKNDGSLSRESLEVDVVHHVLAPEKDRVHDVLRLVARVAATEQRRRVRVVRHQRAEVRHELPATLDVWDDLGG